MNHKHFLINYVYDSETRISVLAGFRPNDSGESMTNRVLFMILSLTVSSAWAGLSKDVTCIAADGLELRIPGGNMFFMQPITLKNDYNPNFLEGLISRHAGQKTKDQNVHMNISLNSCQLKDDLSLACEDSGFGTATYGYSLNGDRVIVTTPVQGTISLNLVRDAKGIFQLSIKLMNNKIKGAILVIQKEIGPLSDPTQTSLTPWSPGCLISDTQDI